MEAVVLCMLVDKQLTSLRSVSVKLWCWRLCCTLCKECWVFPNAWGCPLLCKLINAMSAWVFCGSSAVTAGLGTDLQNILRHLRLSYDNAKVTIDSRRTSNLPNILREMQGFSWVRFICKIVRLSEIVFVNWLTIFPERNISSLYVTIVSQSYDELKIIS